MLSCDVLKTNDGRMTPSYSEVRERVYEYFSNLLNANPITLTQLVELSWSWEEEHASRRFDTPIGPSCVPTFSGTAHMLKAQKIGKGIGEDLIGTEIAHFFPIEIASLLYPLMLKSALMLTAPVQWKGGQIPKNIQT